MSNSTGALLLAGTSLLAGASAALVRCPPPRMFPSSKPPSNSWLYPAAGAPPSRGSTPAPDQSPLGQSRTQTLRRAASAAVRLRPRQLEQSFREGSGAFAAKTARVVDAWLKPVALRDAISRRLSLADVLARRRRARPGFGPSWSDREQRQEVIVNIVRTEMEEAVHFASDLFNASLFSLARGAAGGDAWQELPLLEGKAAALAERHSRRWPLVAWLMGPELEVILDPMVSIYSPQQRSSKRDADLWKAIDEVVPAFVAKVSGACQSRPSLALAVGVKLVQASWLLIAYQARAYSGGPLA